MREGLLAASYDMSFDIVSTFGAAPGPYLWDVVIVDECVLMGHQSAPSKSWSPRVDESNKADKGER